MRYLLDTNVCINVLRNPNSGVAGKFKAHGGQLAISTITLHELIHGVERSSRPTYQRELVDSLSARVAVLEFDAQAADHSGEIHATLVKAGQIIGAYDMLIAGHARSLGLTVVTNNLREFTRVQGLRCEDWLVA